VNLDFVVRLRAPWLLVADIERGGVFASVQDCRFADA
jgi:cobyric acid synthase